MLANNETELDLRSGADMLKLANTIGKLILKAKNTNKLFRTLTVEFDGCSIARSSSTRFLFFVNNNATGSYENGHIFIYAFDPLPRIEYKMQAIKALLKAKSVEQVRKIDQEVNNS